MAVYDYPDDGNLHTRYSELVNCGTMAGAYRVAEEKLGITQRRSNKILEFGQDRHEMWEEEGRETGLTPQCFADGTGVQRMILEVEKHRATEIFAGVIFHFTTDAVVWPEKDAPHSNTGVHHLIDYKTGSGHNKESYPKLYSSSIQLPVYAYLLRPHGYNVQHGMYLIELWDRERKNLQGYMYVEKPIGLRELAAAKQFLRKCTENLIAAMDAVARQHNLQ